MPIDHLISPERVDDTEQEESLPLATVIGKAVSQCARAQQAAARSMWERLEEIAFDSKGGKKEVAMIRFDFQVEGKKMTVRLPLISVLPAQYILIRDVQVDFNVSIDAEEATKTAGALARRCMVRVAPSRTQIQRTKNSRYNLHNNISVKIKAGNLDMSGGMARLLEMAGSRGILIRPVEEEAVK